MIYKVYLSIDGVSTLGPGWRATFGHEGNTAKLNENFGPLPRGGAEIAQLERIRRECIDKYVAHGGMIPGDVIYAENDDGTNGGWYLYTGHPPEGGFVGVTLPEALEAIHHGIAAGYAY